MPSIMLPIKDRATEHLPFLQKRTIMLKITCFLVVCFSLLTGCATHQVFKGPTPATEGNAKVYVYRPKTFVGSASCPSFKMGANESEKVDSGGFVEFSISPGTYLLESKRSWCFDPLLRLSLDLTTGQTQFVRMTFSMQPKPGFWPPNLRGQPWLGLEIVPAERAVPEMMNPELNYQ